MADEEILLFAKTEGMNLTSDALICLRDELNKRNIGREIMEALEHEIIFQYGLKVKKFEENAKLDIYIEAWNYAFKMKAGGHSDYEIHSGLQQMSISSEYAFYITSNLRKKAESLIKDSISDAQAGLVIMIIGFFLVYYSFQIGHFQAVAILIGVAGIFRIALSNIRKSRYQKIIDNIENEPDFKNNP